MTTTKAKPLDAATAATIAAALAPAAVQVQGTSLPTADELPAVGTTVTVQDPTGVLLNLETGQRFVAGQPTPQRVTAHTLQRLQDGCLLLVA